MNSRKEQLVKVAVKSLDASIDVKTNGIEFEVRNNKNEFLGDLFITKKGLIWCKGKTQRRRGKSINWEEFTDLMANR